MTSILLLLKNLILILFLNLKFKIYPYISKNLKYKKINYNVRRLVIRNDYNITC